MPHFFIFRKRAGAPGSRGASSKQTVTFPLPAPCTHMAIFRVVHIHPGAALSFFDNRVRSCRIGLAHWSPEILVSFSLFFLAFPNQVRE